MSAALLLPRSRWEPTPALPAGTCLGTLVVSAAYRAVSPEIQRDIREGRNSARVGRAFRELETRDPLFPPIGRRARGRGIQALRTLATERDGVL